MHFVTMIPANFPSRATRGAQFAATVFASVGRWMLRLVQPAASRRLTRTEEAAEVRTLASATRASHKTCSPPPTATSAAATELADAGPATR